MADTRADLEELRVQLDEGAVRRAYAALLGYLSGLRTQLEAAHPDWSIGALYQGVFDMTYFPVVTPALKDRGLKLAIVFDYTAFRFQVWLAARNRTVQREYWEHLRDAGWPAASLVEPAAGVDAIVVADVADGLALAEPASLSEALDGAAAELLGDLERFLAADGTGA